MEVINFAAGMHPVYHQGSLGLQLFHRISPWKPLQVNLKNIRINYIYFKINVNYKKGLTNNDMELLMPGYSNYPESFRTLIVFLLASLVHNDKWLRQNLPSVHPLFLASVYTCGFVDRLHDKVLLGITRCPVTNLLATGVPTHIMLSKEIQDLKMEVKDLREEMREDIKTHKEDIIDVVKDVARELPVALKSTMLENFQVEGAVPITRDEVSVMFSSFADRVTGQVVGRVDERLLLRLGVPVENNHQNINPEMAENNVSPEGFRSFVWGGRIHMVPENFVLAPCPVYTVWMLWYKGNPHNRIQPYKNLQAFDLVKRVDKVNLTRIRKVMAALESIMFNPDFNILGNTRRIADLIPSEANDAFNRAFVILCKSLYHTESEEALVSLRINDKSFNTIYEQLRKLI